MLFTLQDIAGLMLAIALAMPVLVLPGALVARASGLLGFDALDAGRRLMVAALAGLATVPLAASLLARFVGLDVALCVLLVAGFAGGVAEGRRLLPDWTRRTWGLIAAVVAVFGFLIIDLAGGGKLYPSLLMMDLVKHAAFTRAIVEAGATPPIDPFFLRPGAASYYYFFYTVAALIERAGFGLVDSRMAFAGLIPWTALATIGLADLVYEKAGFARQAGERREPLLMILMSTAGFQLVFVVMFWLKGETWREQSGWLNDMVASFLTSAVWVPHHLAALLAAWVGLLAIVDAAHDDTRGRTYAVRIALAAAAFACAAGLSVWVVLGAAATVAVWFALSLFERRYRLAFAIAASGAVALVLIAPHLIDLKTNRDFGEFPIVFRVRFFAMADALSDAIGGGQAWMRLLLLPVNYFWEAALLVMGTAVFWQRNRMRAVHANEVARLLTISAGVSLVIASFFASAIANNDLGWRILLFAQFSAVIWTACVIWPLWLRASRSFSGMARLAFVPRPMVAMTALGLLAGLHDMAMLRAHVLVNQGHPNGANLDPAVMFDERTAYRWLDRSTAHAAVIQHNPDVSRAYGFGLYGRQRTAVSDLHQAVLFGAAPEAVAERLKALSPLFHGGSAATDLKRQLAAAKVDAVVVTARDGAWKARNAWVFASPALLVRDNLRIVAIGDLTDGAATK